MCALKLGSLFDGIGVFPLAASRNGIIPVWASEIEKSPIAITKRHFPDMETSFEEYVMSMPLYRQEKDFEHLGVKISRTTMASWIIYCAENYFLPMYEYLHRKLLKRRYLMADETPIQVLKEEGRRPQSKSYVWLVRTGDNGGIPIL